MRVAVSLCSRLLTFSVGVLSATLSTHFGQRSAIEIEAHVQSDIENDDDSLHARVVHIVIRLDTLQLERLNLPYEEAIASMDGPLAALSRLRGVTLETIDDDESYGLARQLDSLHSTGKLYRRTCEEARKVVEDVRRQSDSVTMDGLSPLWFSDKYSNDERFAWCVIIPCAHCHST